MTSRNVRFSAASEEVLAGLGQVRADLGVAPDYDQATMEQVADLAGLRFEGHADATDIPFVTIDPPDSMDLDQAVHLARVGRGYLVHYAIADVAAFVDPGSPLDEETRRRGLTMYSPDSRVGLHPPAMSEGFASLLPDQARPAALWRIELDADGDILDAVVTRAMVRSRAKLSYEDVQRQWDDGTAPEELALLAVVGALREEQERARHGISLPAPAQLVEHDEHGYHLAFRTQVAAERYNAQISLLTGIAAAALMLQAGVGILRTMPPPQRGDIRRVRAVARALDIEWPQDGDYPALIRGTDPGTANGAAFLNLATTLLRGAGYTAFDQEPPEQREHSAVAAPYAHVTAPLRRLVDRFGTEVALAHCAGRDVPDWVRQALPELPAQMAEAATRARKLEGESLNLLEALVLQDKVGEEFDGVVVDDSGRRPKVVVRDPAIRAQAVGEGLHVGTDVRLRLVQASPEQRMVLFEPV